MTIEQAPQKDGWVTEYDNGVRLFGTWRSRLEQWYKLREDDNIRRT